jgi:Leucine-rich repeat (LRR) protein
MTQIINFFKCIRDLICINIEYLTKKREWNIDDFNKWCENGRPINKNVIRLDISNSNVKSLKGMENLVNLKYLYCYNNQLTSLKGIENLINLTELYCYNNQLTSLKGIENLINLTELYCHDNQLTLLEGIENLINLKYLDCSHNFLKSLKEMKNLVNLKYLFCYINQLTSLEGIENLVNLEYLYYKHNQLTTIKCIEVFIKLLKNNKKIVSYIHFDTIDFKDYIELIKLFSKFYKLDESSIKFDEYIDEMEKIILDFNMKTSYQTCVI